MWFRGAAGRSVPLAVGAATPGLVLSDVSIQEGTAQGVAVATATPVHARNPGPVSIVSQDIADALQINVDGVTVEAGSHTLVLGVDATPFTITFEYTDDTGPHQFVIQFNIVAQNAILDMSGASIFDMGDAAITDMAA